MGVCLLLAVFMLTGPFANIWTEQGTMTVNSSSGNSGETKEEQKLPVIALDAGHGGDDPGKIGINGALEKDINLAVVKKVKALLEERNVAAEVILTRENEEGLYSAADSNKKIADLNKRCRIIEENKADFVVSVHQNSYNDGAGILLQKLRRGKEAGRGDSGQFQRNHQQPEETCGKSQWRLLYAFTCVLSDRHCRMRFFE